MSFKIREPIYIFLIFVMSTIIFHMAYYGNYGMTSTIDLVGNWFGIFLISCMVCILIAFVAVLFIEWYAMKNASNVKDKTK